MPNEGEMVSDGDPILTPVTEETTDENGNTVVVGYPPGSVEGWTGTPVTSESDSPGAGVGVEPPEGEGA